MPQYQIVVHVEENNESGAQEWLSRMLQILQQYKDVLVSKSTGKGTWCNGHVFPPAEESLQQADTHPEVPKPRP